MRTVGALVLGVFFLPLVCHAQVEVGLRLAQNLYPLTNVRCYENRADLDVFVGNTLDKKEVSLRLIINNFKSLVNNSSENVLNFDLTDSTVGKVFVNDGRGETFYIRPNPLFVSQCKAKITRGANSQIDVSLTCENLAPSDKNLTLEERSKKVISSLSLNPEIRCSVVADTRK